MHFVNTGDSGRLDNEFLQHIGGINDNSFIRVLDPDIDEDNELNCPQIISYSSFYDSEKLSIILQTCQNKIIIFSTNIQSINAKIDELRLFIEHLKTYNFMFSVTCNPESWLSKGADTFLIQLEGYKCIPQGKSCSTKGGLIIYFHENLNYKLKLELTKYETWEGQCIEVMRGKTLTKPLYIGNIYRAPTENLEFYNQFIEEFAAIFVNLERK